MARKKKTPSKSTRSKGKKAAKRTTKAKVAQTRQKAKTWRTGGKGRSGNLTPKKNAAGGSATAAGINFQAAVTACVATHIATGEALRWLAGIAHDVPTVLLAE